MWTTDRRLVAREDVDVAQGKFQQAQAEVEELEAMVGYTHIVAPFDGVITARYVDPGALIQASAHAASTGASGGSVPVVRIADIDTLRVYVYVPEEETSLIKRGMPATLRLREFPGREFTGRVAPLRHRARPLDAHDAHRGRPAPTPATSSIRACTPTSRSSSSGIAMR